MHWIARLIRIVLLLAIAGWAFLFALENPQPFPLVLVPFELPPHSLGFWVLAAFAIGSIVGMMTGSWALAGQKRIERRIRRELRDSRADLDRADNSRAKVLQAPSADTVSDRDQAA